MIWNGFYSPIGGRSRLVTRNVAIHNAPFNRFGIALGARTTAIKLEKSATQAIVVYSPIPWGPEAENMLKLLDSDNVKYIIAPDIEHHMGVDSWKKQFPEAIVIAPSALAKKRSKNPERAAVDVQILREDAYKVTTANLPAELAAEFEYVYVPEHRNRELVIYHKPSKSVVTADLLVNMPAVEQYEGSGMNPTGGFSYILHYLAIGSRLQHKLAAAFMNLDVARPGLEAIASWPMDRIIMCHGEIIENNANSEFSKQFGLSRL